MTKWLYLIRRVDRGDVPNPREMVIWEFDFMHLVSLQMHLPMFISSLAFGIVSAFNFSHSNEYAVVSFCSFNFHFPDD